MIPECPRSGETRNRTQCHYGQVAEPNQNCFGLLSEIKTLIKNEPFTDHYTIIPGKELGRGKFAVVRKCVEKCTGQEYAAKFMRKRRKGQDCRLEIIHEVAVLELATASQRVVNLHQVYEMASEMVLVLQFAAGGEIFNQSESERDEAFIEEDVKRVLRQILEESPSSTEQRGALDIKFSPTRPSSSNAAVQVSPPLEPTSRNGLHVPDGEQQSGLREIMGTPEYVAPEILDYEPISTATECRSIGVLTYVMLTGTSPFLGEDKQETFLNISQINVSYQEDELEHVDQAAIAFIKLLLVKEPQNRATAEECLQHQWLQPKEKREAEATVEVKETISPTKCTSEPANPESHIRGEEEEGPETEELIVMAAYTLGHCRQSTDKEVMAPDQKAISKRFKFEEPFSALQEVPGEFIY
ncbi:LOW QUALITY PROTEIN: serine/threonine-protein kinase 17A [Salvelinus sp. IW2-2015]|uniref:LOW QUALITY PROTEIN: serine/threonine-protein kinase 17A n=1 Tax=Salvelinus sp. IW2-2015 TaxID=2691554 RepID=UPI0038D38A47